MIFIFQITNKLNYKCLPKCSAYLIHRTFSWLNFQNHLIFNLFRRPNIEQISSHINFVSKYFSVPT